MGRVSSRRVGAISASRVPHRAKHAVGGVGRVFQVEDGAPVVVRPVPEGRHAQHLTVEVLLALRKRDLLSLLTGPEGAATRWVTLMY